MSYDEAIFAGKEDHRRQVGILCEVLEQFPITLTVEELVHTQATQRLDDQGPNRGNRRSRSFAGMGSCG